jgi:purine-binding chemotaxis protein CheW
MDESGQLLVFTLDGQAYGLPLAVVDRVLLVVDVVPLPGAPPIVGGVINMHGEIIGVMDIRWRLHLPTRETELYDRMIVAHTTSRNIAFITETVVGVREYPEGAIIYAKDLSPHLEHAPGVCGTEDGLIIVYDLDRFLFPNEESALEEALEKVTP